ncbi:RNA-directed DNA polymerase, eukaryota, reverse transcriptase zinc-binding domain protein [Tanacetum coccineum]|uniref:RNA-directed DNA polymerase, eukaryota, reverse transcriptase zinc-binding domain protein n=1 Tax=Tanacetum coccineum TaxID=301880 RepID=A0ABQ4WBX5_9ASTR
MGDFNEVRNKNERFGTIFNVHGANTFNSFISMANLEEVPLGGSITLDRFLSDHRPILLRESTRDYGPIPFRFFHYWLEMESFENFVNKVWREAPELADLEMIIDKGDASSDTLHKRADVVKSIQEVDKLCGQWRCSKEQKSNGQLKVDENSKYYHESSHSFKRVVDAGMFNGIVLNSVMHLSHMFYADDAVFYGAIGSSSKVGGNMSRIKSWDEIVDKMMLLFVNGFLAVYNSKNCLWTRVIKAIHGEDGKNSSGFKVGYKSIWRSILQEEDLWHGDMVLKQRYPRLYALEVKKTVDVTSKLSQENLTWSFRRAPRSGVEQDQLTDLTTYVEGVVLGVTPDRWYWTLDGSGEFSVASARKVIDDNRFPEVSTQTRWIKAVPIKVNIHGGSTDKTKITRKPSKTVKRQAREWKSVQEPEAKVKKSKLSVNYGCLVGDHVKAWDQKLCQAEFAHNHAVNRSTWFSPFQVVYFAQPCGPLDLMSLPVSESVPKKVQDFVERFYEVHKAVRDNLVRATSKYKQDAYQKRRQVDFKVGDFV